MYTPTLSTWERNRLTMAAFELDIRSCYRVGTNAGDGLKAVSGSSSSIKRP
jgi:hypothetical protein